MSDKGTVVIVNYNAGSPKYGPNLRGYFMAKYLARKGYDVQVFSSAYFHKYAVLPEVTGKVTQEKIDGATYNWIRTRPYDSLVGRIFSFHQYAHMLPAAIRAHVPEMKALICSSPPTILSKVTHRMAREYGARFIFEVRDLWPLTILEMGTATRANPYIMLLGSREKYAYRHADKVVSALPCAEDYLLDRGMQKGKFYSIENGIESGAPAPVNPEELPEGNRSCLEREVPFRVGYSGAFDRDNDVMSLIDAAELLADTDIEFVAVGDGIRRSEILERTSTLPNFHVLPRVRSEQVPWVLERYDVCYMGLKDKPINSYGVSMAKIFEYLRSERPIISAIKAGNDIVKDAGCGITTAPENPREIADAILQLKAMTREERDEMGKRGSAYMEQHHSYDVLVERWVDVIEGNV